MTERQKLLHLLHESAFGLLAAVAVVLVVVSVLAFSGRLVSDEPQRAAARTTETAAEPAATTTPRRPRSPRRASVPVPTTVPAPTEPAVTQPPVFRIAASRGDCWLQARAGSATGRVLYEGLLVRGGVISLQAERLWLRLGAAANVDVTVGGRRRPLPAGTVDVLVDERRAASA